MYSQSQDYEERIPKHADGTYDPSEMLVFNRMLDQDLRSLLNEKILEKRIHQAYRIETPDQRLFWMTLARITELAIFQAGAYADACEFMAAGDLLVNPRRIEIHLTGQSVPVVKHRHMGLGTQFKSDIGQESPVYWLARETTPCIKTEALLPWLCKTLGSSGLMAHEYIESLHRRMNQVADTLAFLNAWKIDNSVQLLQRIRRSNKKEAAFVETHLCRFDLDRFYEIYEEIQNLHYTNQCSTRLPSSYATLGSTPFISKSF